MAYALRAGQRRRQLHASAWPPIQDGGQAKCDAPGLKAYLKASYAEFYA